MIVSHIIIMLYMKIAWLPFVGEEAEAKRV